MKAQICSQVECTAAPSVGWRGHNPQIVLYSFYLADEWFGIQKVPVPFLTKYIFFSLRWCSISQMVLFIPRPPVRIRKLRNLIKKIKLLTVSWYFGVSHLITLLGFLIYFERWEKWWQSILPTSSWTWWSDGGTCDFRHEHTTVTYLRVLLF